MKRLSFVILILGLVLGSLPASASFMGDYAPANWTLTTNGGDGSVDTSGAPDAVTLSGSDTDSGGSIVTDFTIAATGSGMVSFDWAYQSFDVDLACCDLFGFLLNGLFTQLMDENGAAIQNGSAAFAVMAGDIFGFRIDATDDTLGRAETTIRGFEVAAVPEPATLALMGLGLAGLGFSRRQRK